MSIATYITGGLHSTGSIKDYILRGLAIGDDSIISDADAEKVAVKVWEKVLDGNYEAQELMRGISAMLFAKISDMEQVAPVVRSVDDSKIRFKWITDEFGNRLSRPFIDLT